LRLSIIIPVYNVEKYISRCLDSLIYQGLPYNDYEILIISDGSKDRSIEIANKYTEKYENFKVINKDNGGVGSARNKGISLAKGKYIYFIDPDDYLAANMLGIVVDYAEKNALEILTFLTRQTLASDLKETQSKQITDLNVDVTTGIEYIANNYYSNEVWWFLIQRDFLEKINIKFIEGRWMEDAIFTAKTFVNSQRISKVPIDIHRHVITPQSAMTNKKPAHYLGVIRDNANAAIVFKSIIDDIDTKSLEGELCSKRLKTRQQSFVFFMMIRMLKSMITLKEIKSILKHLKKVNAYPLHSFIGKDYNRILYVILAKMFNNKTVFYIIFTLFNPILRRV